MGGAWLKAGVDRLVSRWRFVALLPQASLPLSLGVLALLALEFVLPVASILLLAEAATEARALAVGHGGAAPPGRLVWTLGALGAVMLGRQIVGSLTGPLSDQLGLALRSLVFQRTLRAQLRPSSISHLLDPGLKDLIANTAGRYGPRMALNGLVSGWSARLGAMGAIGVAAAVYWWAGALLLGAFLLALGRTRAAHLDMAKTQYSQAKVLRRSDYLRDLLVRRGAEKEVRLFGLQDWIIGQFKAEWTRAMEPLWRRRRNTGRDAVVSLAPLVAVSVAILLIAVHDAGAGTLSPRAFVALLTAVLGIPLAAVARDEDTWIELGSQSVAAMLAFEGAIAALEPAAAAAAAAPSRAFSQIRLEAVEYVYPGRQAPVFRGLDLTLEAGKSLALVGENGAGKSTIVKLLTRLIEPTAGRIRIDGEDIRRFGAEAWQQRSAALFQDFVRYPWSARANITLGREAPFEVVEAAAERAGAADIIRRLPRGWDTVLSREFGGVDLSGGEWQRVALARALFAGERGADLLILDEPTSHLDVREEARFYDEFLELTRGKTTVLISHRFSTVRRADRIVVLEHGRIVEDGDHEALLAQGGRYARMFQRQAMRFAEDA